LEYPSEQKQVLEILGQFQFEDNKLQGDYVSAIKQHFDKKQVGLAMKFASFVLKEAEHMGSEQALALSSPFDEQALVNQNRAFVFENFPIKHRQVKLMTETDITGSDKVREGAAPGKPTLMFF